MVHKKLKEKYKTEVVSNMRKEFGYENDYAVPRPKKVVINVGLGAAVKNPELIDVIRDEISLITGQRPIITESKKPISNFNIRKGSKIGLKVTLRGNMMWDFMDKLINIVFPRVKDFRGISRKSFDGLGGYSVGIREQTVFPEIDPNKIKKLVGFQVTIDTNAKNSKESEKLLEMLGFPFEKTNIK